MCNITLLKDSNRIIDCDVADNSLKQKHKTEMLQSAVVTTSTVSAATKVTSPLPLHFEEILFDSIDETSIIFGSDVILANTTGLAQSPPIDNNQLINLASGGIEKLPIVNQPINRSNQKATANLLALIALYLLTLI